ncbi:type I-MYXAN CRISPR-associated protein Cmx8 [Deferrisoma camini]|uniref:type I-MYXAN CRISPR-associated protein Cmx8 n=1 Tax=Deferrisoma camini TaxID=1035120 RepID=UPI00046D8703|nr:type I-MYXAN CRISPR-associated protein Cmx8 [Deferrisoma camini]
MTTARFEGNEGKTLVLEYDLFDLPTAQHKAGLAGLLLVVESMKRRGLAPRPEVDVGATSATVRTSREGFQALFDDLYDAEWVETESRQKWPGKTPKRTEEREVGTSDKPKKEKRFIYDVVQPRGRFLRAFYPPGAESWVKLWRDMIWNTQRSRPRARRVYDERADGKPSSLGGLWAEFEKSAKDRVRGRTRTTGFGGSLFVGAQDSNAERVSFKGTVEETLLLHFWPAIAAIYAPSRLKIDRGQEGLQAKSEDAGYLVVIPEPGHLEDFVADSISALGSLDPAARGNDYRPKAARIDVPAEGGLEYLYHLAMHRTAGRELADLLVAVEIYHLEKRGNNVRMLAADRLAPRRRLLEQYERLREQWANPLYKAVRLSNLLADAPWFQGFDRCFAENPWQMFVHTKETPAWPRFFGRDVRDVLATIEERDSSRKGEDDMSEEERIDALALRVHRLIRGYVNARTEERSGKKYKDFKNNRDDKGRVIYPKEYREAREKVCSDAFLAMRGRRDQDFVEYFTGTICSVPHYLPEDDYLAVAQALLADWQTVKTLSMLALSASSFLASETPAIQEDAS